MDDFSSPMPQQQQQQRQPQSSPQAAPDLGMADMDDDVPF